MTFTEEQIEWIVIEVLRRLGATGGECSPTPAANSQKLMLNEKVITLRSIDGRLNGVTHLSVGPRAIVTPAVKDELKQRRIELVREAHQ